MSQERRIQGLAERINNTKLKTKDSTKSDVPKSIITMPEETSIVPNELLAKVENATTNPNQTIAMPEEDTSILTEFRKKQLKPKVEDTHVRRTFLIDRELDERLTQLAQQNGHGFKTYIINKMIKKILDELE